MPRLFDALIALFSLVLLLPVFALISLAIVLGSGLPIFYTQTRVGVGGRTFEMYKFRSMIPDASKVGSWSTQVNDPRITRVGAVLRRTSLDELPQLWNVLKGDMAIVGPRPDVPQQEALYSKAEWELRTSVRPGLTGLAQATERSAATPENRKRLDLQYVEERSFKMDVWIIWRTALQVVNKGSY